MNTIATPRRTGFGPSPFTMGTWPLSGSGHYGEVDEREAIHTIHAALEVGVTSFDTAPGYGQGYAESLLGAALEGRRDRAIITTKFGLISGRDRHSGRASMLAEIDQSLKRLRTDYVDYYVGHWPDPVTPLEETMGALDDIVRAGKARRVGLSNYTLELVQRCRAIRPIDVVQVGYSLFDRRMESDLFPYCLEHGIAIMTYGPLVHGLVIDGISEDTTYPASDWRAKGCAMGQPLLTRENLLHNARVVRRLREEVARPKGMTVSQLALSWVLDHPAVTTALVGARNRSELREDVVRPTPLGPADRDQIEEIMAGARGRVKVFRPYGRAREDWSQ